MVSSISLGLKIAIYSRVGLKLNDKLFVQKDDQLTLTQIYSLLWIQYMCVHSNIISQYKRIFNDKTKFLT